MDPITVAIIAALVTGAAAGTAQVVAENIGGDAYTKLKQLIQDKFGKESELVDAVDKLENDPNSKSRQGLVQEEVEKARADQDAELLEAAQTLLHALESTPEGKQVVSKFRLESTPEGKQVVSKFRIEMKNSQIGVIGDNTKVEGGIHYGPVKKEKRIIHHVGRDYFERIEGDVHTGDRIYGDRAHGIDALKSKEDLQERYSLLSEKISELRKAYIIENDAATKFKLKKQIEENEADLQKIEQRLGTEGA